MKDAYKPRENLDIAYNDKYNEFSCCWIEIINQNNPNILVRPTIDIQGKTQVMPSLKN